MSGRSAQRAPVAGRRLVRLALQPQHIAEIAMRHDIVGPDGEHPPERRRRLLQLALILEARPRLLLMPG